MSVVAPVHALGTSSVLGYLVQVAIYDEHKAKHTYGS
jgi:hypothetical protein